MVTSGTMLTVTTPPERPPTVLELWRAVPRRRPLPDPLWRARHRALLGLLVLHVAGLAPWALANGHPAGHVLAELAGLAGLALVGALARSRTLAASSVSIGLVAAAAVLVHLGGGRSVLHFHFFVVVAALALYQQWLPFGLALTFVLVDHAVMGTLAPQDVYDDAFSLANPLLASAVHGGYVLASAAVSALAWTWADRERRGAEQRAEAESAKVRQSERGLAALLDNAPASIFVKDLRGRFVTVNREMERMLELPAEQVAGRTSAELFGALAAQVVDEHDAEVVATRRASERQERNTVAAGERVLSVVKFPLLDDAGAVTAIAGIATDITERVEAERGLRASEARLRQVFAHGPVPQMVLDPQGTLL